MVTLLFWSSVDYRFLIGNYLFVGWIFMNFYISGKSCLIFLLENVSQAFIKTMYNLWFNNSPKASITQDTDIFNQ